MKPQSEKGAESLATREGFRFQFSILFLLLLTFHSALVAAVSMFEIATVPSYT